MEGIVFTDVRNIVAQEYYPEPAGKNLPEWYKNVPPYINGKVPREDWATNATIKKCMPVLDAISAGYLIKTFCDIWITQTDDGPYFRWKMDNAIEFHTILQAPDYPNNKVSFPKLNSPWAIKTPKGYSCLIIPPNHRENVISILPGIVDTDSYHAHIQFPFMVSVSGFEGLIPAGTPIAQVIPIKRSEWKMRIGGAQEQHNASTTIQVIFSVFYNAYKKNYWHKKSYT